MHNRLAVLHTDIQTKDSDSTVEVSSDNISLQNSQACKYFKVLSQYLLFFGYSSKKLVGNIWETNLIVFHCPPSCFAVGTLIGIMIFQILQAHRLIRESGDPHFGGLRIPVKT